MPAVAAIRRILGVVAVGMALGRVAIRGIALASVVFIILAGLLANIWAYNSSGISRIWLSGAAGDHDRGAVDRRVLLRKFRVRVNTGEQKAKSLAHLAFCEIRLSRRLL